MTVARRGLLAGMAAAIAAPALATRPADPAWMALDEAATLPPAEGLLRLAAIDPCGLTAARRLDVETARAGLAIDVALAARPGDFALRLQRQLGTADPARVEWRLRAALNAQLAAADALFRRLGRNRGTIGARYAALFSDPDGHYSDGESGRDQAVADMNRWLADLRRRSIAAFPGAPAFAFDVTVDRLSATEIAAGKGGFRELPTPGKAGRYVVDLQDIARRPSWSLPSVVAHELLPGHMIQLGIETATPPHPLRITYAAAFVEGWGIAAEQCTEDWAPFRNPRIALGHRHWLIFRAARGLLDCHLHRNGWTLDRARAALIDWMGEPAYFAPFDGDLARIMKDPGVRAAEAMAWLDIADRTPHGAGARRDFHRALLASGRWRFDDGAKSATVPRDFQTRAQLLSD